MKSPIDSFVVVEKHRYKTAASFVVETLRQGILSGSLAEGTPLRQDELAEKFDLSRMPIRDALRQLEAEGLVDQEPHKGAVVATMAVDDIVEIFDMRVMAECAALKIAFPSLTKAGLEELSDILDAMDATSDADRLSELNQKFHGHLYREANRPRLQALIKSLHDSVDRYLRLLLVNLDYHNKSQKDHRIILEACLAGNQHAAVRALEKHLVGGRDEVVAFLARRQTSSQPT